MDLSVSELKYPKIEQKTGNSGILPVLQVDTGSLV